MLPSTVHPKGYGLAQEEAIGYTHKLISASFVAYVMKDSAGPLWYLFVKMIKNPPKNDFSKNQHG